MNRPSCDATSATASALVVHELCGSQMPRPAELARSAFGLGLPPTIGSVTTISSTGAPPVTPANLGAERVKLVPIGHHGRAVHGRQPRQGVDCAVNRFRPFVLGHAVVPAQDVAASSQKPGSTA